MRRVDSIEPKIAIPTIYILCNDPLVVLKELEKVETNLPIEVQAGEPVLGAGNVECIATEAHPPHYEPEMILGCSLAIADSGETGTFGPNLTMNEQNEQHTRLRVE
jgi:hypothetical protein